MIGMVTDDSESVELKNHHADRMSARTWLLACLLLLTRLKPCWEQFLEGIKEIENAEQEEKIKNTKKMYTIFFFFFLRITSTILYGYQC